VAHAQLVHLDLPGRQLGGGIGDPEVVSVPGEELVSDAHRVHAVDGAGERRVRSGVGGRDLRRLRGAGEGSGSERGFVPQEDDRAGLGIAPEGERFVFGRSREQAGDQEQENTG
jgi:hypothetical protein